MTTETGNKMRWLKPGMNGDDDAVIRALRETLPGEDGLDANGTTRLNNARLYMGELFARGVSLQAFYKRSGMTGFPVDPDLPGLTRQRLFGDGSPTYFDFWLADATPSVAAGAVKALLQSRKAHAKDSSDAYVLQLFIDVDSDSAENSFPFEAGLTPDAVCMEFRMNDIEQQYARIDDVCAELGPQAQKKLRVGLGTFAQQEFDDFCRISLYSKRMMYHMAMEWILFKNVHRRAGRLSWLWRAVARWRDRTDG